MRAQISPGPLARAHESLDAVTTCFKCHGLGAASMDDDCLECHQGVRWLIQHDLGLHGVESGKKCAGCHPDHGGRDFDMIGWDGKEPGAFDHAGTGWDLDGKHRALKCRDCHQPKYQTLPTLNLFKRTRMGSGWIGLERDCISCHADPHQGSLDPNCAACHTTRVWTPAAGFDHSRSAYPLTGKHEEVKCAECHQASRLDLPRDESGRTLPLYKPLSFARCTDCHADPHRNALGPKCASCHVTQGWERIDEKRMNHDLTRYPLRGKHTSVRCAQCHDPVSAWGKKPKYATCDACHADPHAGKATLAGQRVDCARCHRVEGFTPSTYTVAMHVKSAYPLEGRHQSTACKACHSKNPAAVAASELGKSGVWMRPPHARCLDCHADDHGGQYADRPDRGGCERCHGLDGWKPSTYPFAEHQRLDTPLDGSHGEAECADCHGPLRRGLPALPARGVLGKAGVVLTPRETKCDDCHVDPHSDGPIHQPLPPDNDACRSCHGFDDFRPSRVDVAAHEKMDYALEGAHRAVLCQECHPEMKSHPAGSSLVVAVDRSTTAMPFVAKHRRCSDCHENPHGGQFEGRSAGAACDVCHGLAAFEPASAFDHDRDSRFRLDGAHENVYCKGCHPIVVGADGQPEVVYRPLSLECRSCHDDASVSSLEDPAR